MSDEWGVRRVGCQTSGVSDEWGVGRVGCWTIGVSDEWVCRQTSGVSDE